MILFKLCRIGPLPLGVIVPNLQKNLSTLIAKNVISRNFDDFRKKTEIAPIYLKLYRIDPRP
jgi:hypothetical protein